MDISGLYARISDDQQQIDLLEGECTQLRKNIETMYEEEEEHCKIAVRFRNMLEAEKDNVSHIQSLENIHIAQACSEDINDLISGGKANIALDGLKKISAAFERRIDESEENVRNKRNEITTLYDDIAYCYREIARLEEEARQEAARQAARQAANSNR